MSTTWLQFKTDTKKLITDITASDDLFAAACANYVKAMVSREVDHDLLMRKSYWEQYMDLRRRLLGYSTALVPGSTLDVEVKKLLPVDAQREGIQTYITQQIKNAYYEMTTLNAFIEKTMRSAIIDLMSYISCYRVGKETIYTSANVTEVGNMSRGPMPEQAELREGYFLLAIDELAEDVAYASGDYVASNGRTYLVLTDGTLATGELDDGLTTTDGSVETLGGMQFMFYYGEACLRSDLVIVPWTNRFEFNRLLDGCLSGDADRPAMIAIDPESYSFFVWPKLDDTHTISLFWTSVKFDFSDGSNVPFDEEAQNAVAAEVLSRYYLQIEDEPQKAKYWGAQYLNLRSRAYVNCKDREFLQYK